MENLLYTLSFPFNWMYHLRQGMRLGVQWNCMNTPLPAPWHIQIQPKAIFKVLSRTRFQVLEWIPFQLMLYAYHHYRHQQQRKVITGDRIVVPLFALVFWHSLGVLPSPRLCLFGCVLSQVVAISMIRIIIYYINTMCPSMKHTLI